MKLYQHELTQNFHGYLELVEQTEGLEFEQYRILFKEYIQLDLMTVTTSDLAEFDDGIIAIKEGNQTENCISATIRIVR